MSAYALFGLALFLACLLTLTLVYSTIEVIARARASCAWAISAVVLECECHICSYVWPNFHFIVPPNSLGGLGGAAQCLNLM